MARQGPGSVHPQEEEFAHFPLCSTDDALSLGPKDVLLLIVAWRNRHENSEIEVSEPKPFTTWMGIFLRFWILFVFLHQMFGARQKRPRGFFGLQ